MRHLYLGLLLAVGLVVIATDGAFAQQGKGNECTIAGTWYGGSVVAYT